MTEREKRVADAMIQAVKRGDYFPRYITILLEDDSKYGWMSQKTKDYIYDQISEE